MHTHNGKIQLASPDTEGMLPHMPICSRCAWVSVLIGRCPNLNSTRTMVNSEWSTRRVTVYAGSCKYIYEIEYGAGSVTLTLTLTPRPPRTKNNEPILYFVPYDFLQDPNTQNHSEPKTISKFHTLSHTISYKRLRRLPPPCKAPTNISSSVCARPSSWNLISNLQTPLFAFCYHENVLRFSGKFQGSIPWPLGSIGSSCTLG